MKAKFSFIFCIRYKHGTFGSFAGDCVIDGTTTTIVSKNMGEAWENKAVSELKEKANFLTTESGIKHMVTCSTAL